MILSEYNEEFHLKCLREEAREIGYEEGLEAGIESGRQKATDTLNLLTLKLLEQNRTEDLKKAASDPEYQLLREFHLTE